VKEWADLHGFIQPGGINHLVGVNLENDIFTMCRKEWPLKRQGYPIPAIYRADIGKEPVCMYCLDGDFHFPSKRKIWATSGLLKVAGWVLGFGHFSLPDPEEASYLRGTLHIQNPKTRTPVCGAVPNPNISATVLLGGDRYRHENEGCPACKALLTPTTIEEIQKHVRLEDGFPPEEND